MMAWKTTLSAGNTLYGVLVTISSSCVSETLSECFDWLWIDMEHAPLSLSEVQAMAQAVNKRCKHSCKDSC